MRLWHYKLISVLPNKMLVSQWRECIAIKRQWEKGTLKHRLVGYVMKYKKALLYYYTNKVALEMKYRNIKYQEKYLQEFDDFAQGCYTNSLYPEHNNRYLRQCYYNLQEKADRGIITKEEWKLIHKNIYGLIEEEI